MARTPDKKQELEAYLNLGRSYTKDGQIQLAVENYQQAYKRAKILNDKMKELDTIFELAHAYELNYQIHQAMNTYNEALEITRTQEETDKKINALG